MKIPKPQTGLGAFVELVLIVALAIGLALGIQAFLVRPYQIPSGSMIPTLEIHQRILVNRLTYRLGADPSIGDVVVFHPPLNAVPEEQAEKDVSLPECPVPAKRSACPTPGDQEADSTFVKRVVAGPGDTLKIVDGHPIVNGEAIDESEWTLRKCRLSDCNYPEEITIPPDHYFMMGDNRGASKDSRYWGPVPRDWLIGEAFATYWPIDRIGLL